MIRGWCPTVHAPMPSGDGLLVRVKPFGGRLTTAMLQALAHAAAAYGNGVIQLTLRGHLQMRGIHDPAAFARAMVAAGLADGDPMREARRNVIAVPPCDDALVAEAETMLAETAGRAPKYCVTVHGDRVYAGNAAITAYAGEGHLLYLPFGHTDAATLTSLETEVRTTPWRALLSPVRAPAFDEHPTAIAACPGAPACASATVAARSDAALLAKLGLRDLHVSGCSKGCAHPRAATTLVGRDGFYDLVRNGHASDPPDRTGLTLEQAISAL